MKILKNMENRVNIINKRKLKNLKSFKMLALLAAAMLFCACGSKASTETKESVSISKLQETMLAADTTLPEMVVVSDGDEQADLNFSYLSDLSYEMVDSYFYAYAKDGTAEEIAAVKLKDKGDAAAMMDSFHEHIKQRKGTFQEYDPQQVEMVEHAVVTRQGNYVTLIISQKNGLVQKAFQQSLE